MRIFIEKYLVFFLLLFSHVAKSQDENPPKEESDAITVRPAPFSIRSEFSVPTPLNSAWRKCMVGVVEGNASFNYKIYKNFFAGIGYKFSLLYTPPKFFLFDLKTKMQMHDVYLKLGYDFYQSNKYFITPAINSGFCFTKYTSVQPVKKPLTYRPQYNAWFIEPQVAFNFLPDPRFGICFHVSYVIVDHVWDPYYIAMQDWISLSDVKTNGITSYINFGFGVYVGIGNGKRRAGK